MAISGAWGGGRKAREAFARLREMAGLPAKKGQPARWTAHRAENGDVLYGPKEVGTELERRMELYHEDDPDDPNFDVAFRAQAVSDNEKYAATRAVRDLGDSRRRGGRWSEEKWMRFERAVAAGAVTAGMVTEQVWNAYLAAPIRLLEVLDACAAAKAGTAASPSDWVAPEVLKHGGIFFYKLLHLAFNEIHAGAAPPREWGLAM